MNKRLANFISFLIYLVIIPTVIALGIMAKNKHFLIIGVAVTILACIPFFVKFELSFTGVREVVIIAVMVAVAVLGRIIFAFTPNFKPVTAIVIITAVAFGREAGFITGACSALISNMFFGQGPWTPFQMFVWGIIGFVAGIIFYNKKINKPVLIVFSAIAGGIFSLLMDVWTTLSIDGVFNLSRYFANVALSGVFVIIYMVSNVIFVIVFMPMFKVMERIKTKYGVFTQL